MNIVNEKVEHNKFGSGVISELTDNRIVVEFQDGIGAKEFLYPEAFEEFLKAVNPSVEKSVLKVLRKKQELPELIKEREAFNEKLNVEIEINKIASRKKKGKGSSSKS